jgi:uncharacterized protein YndB with AHSA1/START domain
MSKAQFVYVTYIRTTPEKLWRALTEPEFTRQFWYGAHQDCDWTVGSPWKLIIPDGRIADSGEVLEVEKPHRLVLSWRNEFTDMREEGYSRLTYLIEPQGEIVKLTVTHEMDREGSKLIAAVSNGWPTILASLKSLLETGASFEATRRWPAGI